MASISHDGNGRRRLQFIDTDKERKSIRLGKVSKRDAEIVKSRVESLLSAKICGTGPSPEMALWVSTLSQKLQHDLAKFALIDIGVLPKPQRKKKLSEFLTEYIEKRGEGKKPATIIVWKQVVDSLNESMAGKAIQDITTGDAEDWIDSMRTAKLAPTTIHKRMSFARQFFGYAIKHKILSSNPFASIKIPRPKTKSNVEVDRQSIAKLLEHCDPVWTAIVVLSRFGGLRCPSEVLSLKWKNIDFAKGSMEIPVPKLEHHDGRGNRLCPLFPEVRDALSKLPRKGEYVIDKPEYRSRAMLATGWANANLRTKMLARLKLANLEPWPRLFHSMRASRQTELEREFGLPAACAWLGNTESVAKESYLLVFADEWKRATQSGAELGASSGVGSNRKASQNKKTQEKSRISRKKRG